MIRVMYVIPSLSVGGSEWQLIRLIQGLSRDHTISVICTQIDGALSGDARRAGAQVRVLSGNHGGWDFRQRTKIRQAIHSYKPDIVHTFLFGFDYWANLAAHDARIPVVISSRRQLATWKKHRHIWLQRRANRLVDCIIANSQAVMEFAQRQEKSPSALYRVIPNGIHAGDFRNTAEVRLVRTRYRIPANTHVIGTLANFSPVKDYPLFVEMARSLLSIRPDVHFLMIGSGRGWPEIEQRLHRLNIRQHFTRVSTVSERADLLAMMSAFVLCSQVEGFPSALLEAMAAGVPVAAQPVGGIPEMLKPEMGWLINERTPAAFAKTINDMLEQPDLTQQRVQTARICVERDFTVERMVNAHRNLYAELLNRAMRQGD